MSSTASLVSQADSVAAGLERYLADLPPEAWAEPSDCAGWTVARVVAHLATAASMFADSVERGLEGESGPPPEAVEGPEVYRAWRERLLREHAALPPAALLAALKESLLQLRRALLRVATEPPPAGRGWHRTGPQPLPWFAGHWLVELSLHDWDLRAAADPAANVNPAAYPGLGPLLRERAVRCFQPRPGVELRGVVRIMLAGESPCAWLMRLAGQTAEVLDDGATQPDARIESDPGAYALVQTSRRPAEHFKALGRWRVEGDTALADGLAGAFKGY